CQAMVAGLKDRGYRIVSGGTDNHLFLIDLTDKGITGKEAEEALDHAGMTLNKNTIPRETRSPFITSGIRGGTPAITTRGMKEAEMTTIANWMADILDDHTSAAKIKSVREEVRKLCAKFPIYRESLS
ncbi:MAG: serine hydroxymethyltransferase, partial [Deltaproteobacteria bacterium]|nr:serine hydroxymethyltransferase [Deltaproteobacteria bacterium]